MLSLTHLTVRKSENQNNSNMDPKKDNRTSSKQPSREPRKEEKEQNKNSTQVGTGREGRRNRPGGQKSKPKEPPELEPKPKEVPTFELLENVSGGRGTHSTVSVLEPTISIERTNSKENPEFRIVAFFKLQVKIHAFEKGYVRFAIYIPSEEYPQLNKR
jgi:hypothetical protein